MGFRRARCLLAGLLFILPAVCESKEPRPEIRLDRAKEAYRAGLWDEAAELYGSLLASGPRKIGGRKIGDRNRQGWHTRRAKALLKLRRHDAALGDLGAARRLAESTGFDRPELDALIGWAHVERGDPASAVPSLEAARQRWRAERETDADPLDRVTLMRQHAHVDRLLQLAYLQTHRPADAYRVSEEARAQTLLALLASDRAGLLDPGLLDPDSWDFERAQRLARDLETTLVSYTLIGSEERILGDEPDTERLLLTYVVSPGGTAVTGLPIEAGSATPLSDLILELRPKMLEGETAAARDVLADLYDRLVRPILAFLPEGGSSLTFLPAGPLHLVPFAALLDRGADGQSPGVYLVERFEVRHGLAAAQLEASRRRYRELAASGESLSAALIVGNPQSGAGERLAAAALPGAEREAEEIAVLLGARSLLGSRSEKVRVLEAMVAAPVLHFATHGALLLDPRLDDLGQADGVAPSAKSLGVNARPGGLLVGRGVRVGGVDASIALAREKVVRVPLAGALALSDGLLFSGEIASLDLSARLAVLSACDTGRGRVTQEGAIGLNWAFLASGVPVTVSSLWAVPDAPTAELMVDLYEHLLEGETVARALRQAMLETLRESPHPKNWAAFKVTGTGALKRPAQPKEATP